MFCFFYTNCLTSIASQLPPMAAWCMAVSPSFPLKSIWQPKERSGMIEVVLFGLQQANPSGVSMLNKILKLK